MTILMPFFENILVPTHFLLELTDCAFATKVKCSKIFEFKTEGDVSTKLA